MSDRLKQWAEVLAKIPDEIIFAETGRRMRARRRSPHNVNIRRWTIWRVCVFCGEYFGAQEIRKHCAKAHPGGLIQNHPIVPRKQRRKPRIKCPYCSEMFHLRGRASHIRSQHPEHWKKKEPPPRPPRYGYTKSGKKRTGRPKKVKKEEPPCTLEPSH